MGLLRWFTKNWANTTDPTHSDLNPLRLPGSHSEAIKRLVAVVGTLPRWSVVASDPEAGTAHLNHTTRAFKFVDDIYLVCSEEGAGTRVDAESRSRVGKGDLGQNRRNILELWKAVR